MTFDGKAFGEEIVAAVKAHVERKLAPILERLERSEQRFDRFDQRIDALALRGLSAGAGVDENAIIARVTEALVPMIDERVQSAVTAIPAPKSVTIDDVRPMIEAEVAAAVARLKQAEPQSRTVASMTINRSGILIAEMDDGWLQNLGPVLEHQANEFEFESAITHGVRALPQPQSLAAS